MQNKTAQGLGFWNSVKEKTNVIEWAREEFSKEYKEYMNQLRNTDDLVRSKAKTVKTDLKQATTLFDKKEYVSFYIPLTRFYNTNKEIYNQLKGLKNDLLEDQFKLLSNKLVESDVDLLKDLEKNFEQVKTNKKKKAYDLQNIIKVAGIFNDMANFLKRRFALQGLEKRHKKFFDQLKKDGQKLINESNDLFNNLISNFDKMAKSRVGREISSYLEAIRDYNSKFESFEKNFMSFYDTYMKTVMEKIKEKEQLEADLKKSQEVLPTEQVSEVVKENLVSPTTLLSSKPKEEKSVEITPEEEKEFVSNLPPAANKEEELKKWEEEQKKKGRTKPVSTTFPAEVKSITAPVLQKEIIDPNETEEDIAKDIINMMSEEDKAKERVKQRAMIANKPITATEIVKYLTKLAENGCSTKDLGRAILKMSENLEEIDLKKSLELLSLAEGLVE